MKLDDNVSKIWSFFDTQETDLLANLGGAIFLLAPMMFAVFEILT